MDNSWLKRRLCGIHMTIRDVDCENFDAEQMARDFHELGIDFFSFFAGGYITTYPSALEDSRISPYLGDRDVTGEIVEAAHRWGIKAIAMADFSVLPPEIYRRHPEWAMVDRDGNPYRTVSGMYTACVMGGYAGEYGSKMVREILERYDVDGMKFGGGSYGFSENICHCESCRKSYYEMYGEDIPDKIDWDDPHWRRYFKWRTIKTSERVRFLHEMVSAVRPDMPVMGNGTCFTDVHWTIGSALDMEAMADYQDMIQIEAQARCTVSPELTGTWQPQTFTGEEAAYLSNVTERPVWVVVSYFKAWPWRRSAIDYAEQKAFLAQIAANGASPMVNLSGGPPKVHEDKRGFRAPGEIWHFIRDHNEYFSFDRSAARTAIVYSPETMIWHMGDRAGEYVDAVRGYERALREHHIPFDIISTNVLRQGIPARYRALILTDCACLDGESVQALRQFVQRGGGLIATMETSLYDADGNRLEDFQLADLFHAHYAGETAHTWGEEPSGHQNYCRTDSQSPLLAGLEDCGLIPLAGQYCRIRPDGEAEIPLRMARPFIVFPEGLSYPTQEDPADPMAILSELPGGGRTVYFAWQPERLFQLAGFGDLSRLLSNAVEWASRGDTGLRCDAPDSVYATLRRQEGRANVHLVNLTGGERMLRQAVDVHDISVTVSKAVIGSVSRAFLLSTGEECRCSEHEDGFRAELPVLHDYDVLIFEE